MKEERRGVKRGRFVALIYHIGSRDEYLNFFIRRVCLFENRRRLWYEPPKRSAALSLAAGTRVDQRKNTMAINDLTFQLFFAVRLVYLTGGG